jgi:myosin heavy subunit
MSLVFQYANRARNIKNRAELNEIEAGWDDVDHLQQLVTRLRNELGILRSGNGTMPAITEEAGLPSRFPDTVSTSANMLHLQEQYADLSTRYAKLTAELAKAQAASSSPSMLSSDSFAKAVEPVVEEYEKSISALESQLSLTKAALSHSEEVMRETEEKINSDAQVLESNNSIIGELKIRLGKLTEREAVTEGYIRDLETRLKSSTEQDEASANLISDLRKEIAKYREVESNTEKYVKDLEARLLKSEETKNMQKNQIESLERDVQRREQAYEELENRLSLLDTTEQHKQLLFELDARDRRILIIQKEMEEAKMQMLALEQDAENMKIAASEDAKQKAGLHRRIESLEKQPRIAITASSNGSENALSAPSSAEALSRSLTPPQTPLHEDGTEDQNLSDSPMRSFLSWRKGTKLLSESSIPCQANTKNLSSKLKIFNSMLQVLDIARVRTAVTNLLLPHLKNRWKPLTMFRKNSMK